MLKIKYIQFVQQFIINQQLIVPYMIRRRSTLDLAQRQKRTKIVEVYSVLDLCLQLPSDDRLLIRNQVKDGDQQLIERIHQCKKDKNYHGLQIYLRKKIQKLKQTDKFGLGLLKNQGRGRTPQNSKYIKNQTENSYHNSKQNSLNSSPSARKSNKTTDTKIENTKLSIQRHIQNEINKQIMHGILKQQCELQNRDITPREIQIQVKRVEFDQIGKSTHSFHYQPEFSMKAILKTKINQKISYRPQIIPQKSQTYINKQNSGRYLRETNQIANKVKAPLVLNRNIQNTGISIKKQPKQQIKYGQFYKRIKKVIQQTY